MLKTRQAISEIIKLYEKLKQIDNEVEINQLCNEIERLESNLLTAPVLYKGRDYGFDGISNGSSICLRREADMFDYDLNMDQRVDYGDITVNVSIDEFKDN